MTDVVDVLRPHVLTLGAQGLAHLAEHVHGVDHLALARRGLVVVQNPDVGTDARVPRGRTVGRKAPRRIRLGLRSFGRSAAIPTVPGQRPSLPVRQLQSRRLAAAAGLCGGTTGARSPSTDLLGSYDQYGQIRRRLAALSTSPGGVQPCQRPGGRRRTQPASGF